MRKIGIYCFENKLNGKKYIGQSIDIDSRCKRHFKDAYEKNSKQYDTPFHRALRKYGEDNFIFSILEECQQEDLDAREKFWIKKLVSLTSQNGYNILAGGQGFDRDYARILQQKSAKAYKEKKGVSTPFQDKQIQQKIKETFLERYGEDSPLKVPEIYAKTQEERYKNGNARCYRNLETGKVFTGAEAKVWTGMKGFHSAMSQYLKGIRKSCGKIPGTKTPAHWEVIPYETYLVEKGDS